MKLRRFFTTLSLSVLLLGCATTQEVTVTKSSIANPIKTIAQVRDAGNSPEMDGNLSIALQKNGLTVRQPLPQGIRQSSEVDTLVSYVDVWRWDIVMYMQSLTVKLSDAKTGDLLAIGQWSDSALHGFRDAKLVMEGLVAEMLQKVNSVRTTSAN